MIAVCRFFLLSILFSCFTDCYCRYLVYPLALQQLLRELEAERERRWKSEQAARKLADLVMVLRTKGIPYVHNGGSGVFHLASVSSLCPKVMDRIMTALRGG